MRIESNFTDYYDEIQWLGVDKTLVWKRETDYFKIIKPYVEGHYDSLSGVFSRISHVGFCGKIYTCVEKTIEKTGGWVYDWETGEKFNDSILLNSLFDELKVPIFLVKSVRRAGQYVINGETNPALSVYEFNKIVNPQQAYQELQMYLTNVLGLSPAVSKKYKGKAMDSHVSDKDLCAAKGFDKFSFRAEKGKKKRKKKKE